jgi:hypothetical protein
MPSLVGIPWEGAHQKENGARGFFQSRSKHQIDAFLTTGQVGLVLILQVNGLDHFTNWWIPLSGN